MRRDISVAELRATLSAALHEVEMGHGLLVTRNGRPVARIEPTEDPEGALRAAGVRPAGRRGPIPRVQPAGPAPRGALTRRVLSERA